MITRIYNKVKRITLGTLLKRKYCPVCKTYHEGFSQLPEMYKKEMKANGFPFTLNDAETLNVQEYTCPVCDCTDRDRLYAIYLEKNINTEKVYSCLDIAPGRQLSGFIKGFSNVTYRSADLFMEGVDDKIDLCDMNIYKDNKFDFFICSHVLEHVPDDAKAMKELYRVLKAGGWGIAMVPIFIGLAKIDEDSTVTDINERWRRFGQDDHLRLYNKEGFLERLTKAGFVIIEYTRKDFPNTDFKRMGISSKSVLYIVNKMDDKRN